MSLKRFFSTATAFKPSCLSFDFRNQAVLVTGGSNGIGRAICESFARSGAVVHSVDIVKPKPILIDDDIEPITGEIHHHQCDVSDREQVRATVAAASKISKGKLNILVNNVAIQTSNTIPCHELDEDAWDRHIAVNLTSYFLFSKYCIPLMLAGDEGNDAFNKSIVNIASVQGLQSQCGIPAYAASKGGVLSLTRQLAMDYAKHNIRVNAINPGTIDTPLLRNVLKERGGNLTDVAKPYPLKRIGSVGEVAATVQFLASDNASFITGEYINVCGGIMAQGGWAHVS